MLWSQAEHHVEKFVRLYTAVTIMHGNNPLRRMGCVSNLLRDLADSLKPIADELRKDWDCGPNEWQQRLVKCIFANEGTTEDRAWWGRTLTNWWEGWKKEEERIRYGF